MLAVYRESASKNIVNVNTVFKHEVKEKRLHHKYIKPSFLLHSADIKKLIENLNLKAVWYIFKNIEITFLLFWYGPTINCHKMKFMVDLHKATKISRNTEKIILLIKT